MQMRPVSKGLLSEVGLLPTTADHCSKLLREWFHPTRKEDATISGPQTIV
jgi:hypothetical protein